MSFSIRLIIVTLLSMLFLFQGCGGGGDSSGVIPVTESQTTTKNGTFAIAFEDKNIDIFDYKLSIKRGGEEITDTMLDYISSEKQSDGSLVISLKEVTTNGETKGLTALEVGDVVTLEAKGYTPQQFVVDADMLKSSSKQVSLKAIESRQTFNLSDMISGSDSVTPKSARGARTVVTEDSVTFETLGSGISLSMPKLTYERLVRKISRLPRSDTNTQVHIDMTSIDPHTEHSATIGNFSYDSSSEPVNERQTNTVDDNSSNAGLESVVMADMKMTTDSGDEIHCFDGTYDPTTNTCSGDATATLKMQIPVSQFNQYAQKYNAGERVVPLYSYNQVKATWVRQVKDGKSVNAELVLTDNDNNQKANDGDILTLVGQVSHFSWWNGDYPIQNTCLNIKIDPSNAFDASYKVLVEGFDYDGRKNYRYLSGDKTEANSINAKKNSIVLIKLIMSDGSIGDSFTYATTNSDDGCEDVSQVLTAPMMESSTLDVIVKDTQGNLLKDAYVRSDRKYHYTDVNGTASFTYTYPVDGNFSKTINVSYRTDIFTATAQQDVTQETTSPVTITLDLEEKEFTGKVIESIDGVDTAAANAYVRIYNYDPYYYISTRTDENGSFTIKLPKSRVTADPTANIYINKYNRDYAFYPSFNKEITGLDTSSDLGVFKLAFSTHTVTGQVSDTEGNAISSATVCASGDSYRYASSDEDGNYEMTIVGDIDKNVTLQAYTYKGRYLYSDKASFITQEKGKTNQNLVIDLRKATIKGRILTSNGIALSGMRVYWSKDYYAYSLTDKDGYFSIKTYSEGDGYIRVYNPSDYSYLDFSTKTSERDVPLDGVEVGKIYDLENLLAVEQNFAPIINEAPLDPTTPIADVAFTISIDAYDPDGDALTYEVENYYSNYGNDDKIELNGNVATITANSAGYYYFRITVTDSEGNSAQRRISSYVKNHVRPVIDSVSYTFPNSKRYFDKSSALDVAVVAHSDEGNSLTYTYKLESLNSDVEDVSLDATTTGVIIPTTVENGRYRLVITVNDIYNTVITRRYITIDDSVAPEISGFTMNGKTDSSITIKENSTVSFDVNLTDATHVTDATWYWYVNGTTYKTQAIDPIAFENQGYFYGYVTVRDARGRSDSKSFYINVQTDAKPIIDSVTITPKTVTKSGDMYKDSANNTVTDLTLNVIAHDDDSSSLTYGFEKLGENNATTVSDNNATYSLSGLSVGKHAIKVTVSDATSTVTRYVNMEVLQDAPPVITEFRVPLNSKVSKTIELRVDATDVNEQTLTYIWSTTAGTLTDKTSKIASLNVGATVQDINVTVTVSDGTNNVSRTRTVKVLANIAPTISYFNLRTTAISLDSQIIYLKSVYGDVDGVIENAKYIIEDSNGKEFGTKTITQSGVITSWELSLQDAGEYKVYLEVTDDNNVTTKSATAPLSVKKANSAPTIISLTATSTNLLETEETTLNVVATDADGDAITYSWSVSDGATIIANATSPDKALFSADTAGIYTVTVVATDTSSAKAIKTLEITVQSASLSISTDKTVYILGSDVTLTASMSSEHTVPSATTWSIVSKPDNSTLSTTSTGASITITPDVVGTYKVKADTTINGVSFSAEKSFTVQEESTTSADLEGVVTSDNGDILSGAKVRLYNRTDSSIYDVTVTTDENGAYSFSEVPAGSYYLVVYAGDGYVSQTQIIEIVK